MNQSLRLRCVCCYTFTQWINLVVCLLDYEWLSGEMNLPLRCVADIMHWINLVVCLLDYEWCTGEINLPLRLRCVRCYTFTHWINLVVCSMDYEWCTGEINLPLRLRCVADIMHWINLAVCSLILRNEWALQCVCWTFCGLICAAYSGFACFYKLLRHIYRYC